MRTRNVVAAVAAMLILSTARAEEPASLTAEVSSREITMADTVQLSIALSRDARQPFDGYLRPDFADFDILHQGQSESTQWTIAGGQQITRTLEEHVYVLRPRHKGKCVIPAASAHVGGRDLHSEAIAVLVHPAPRNAPGIAATGQDPATMLAPSPEAMRGDEDIFIEARADRTQVYLGEPVVVSWWIYTQSDILRWRTTVEPKHDDFWSEDLYVPPGALAWDRADVKGRPYEAALLLRRALFPLKAGKLTITPLEAEATTMQTAFYPTGSAVRGSRPLTVEVLALPAEGRPDGFQSQNVGHFELASSVDRTEVKAGEAVTLKVVVKGEGNVRNVKLRKLDRIDGFRVYEPAVSEHIERDAAAATATADHHGGVRGERTYQYLLLPERGGTLTIPPVELAYFDPADRKYATARAPAIDIKVIGDPGQLGKASAEATKENLLGPRIRPLRRTHHLATRLGERVLRGSLLTVALAAPPALLVTILLGDAVRVGLSRETAGRRRRRARAAGRRRLRAAEGYLKAQRPSAFFAELVRAIYERLEYRLGEKCEAYTLADLRKQLGLRGFDDELATAVVQELEGCDFARFAPSASGSSEMRAALKRVKTLLAQVERAKVRAVAAQEAAA